MTKPIAIVIGAAGGIGIAISSALAADHDVVRLYHFADNAPRIINLGSVNSGHGQVGQGNFAAAKACMHGFSMSLTGMRAPQRRGSNRFPGYTETSMIAALRDEVRDAILGQVPVGRFAKPEKIPAVVSFVASPGGACITGADIPVNDGLHIG